MLKYPEQHRHKYWLPSQLRVPAKFLRDGSLNKIIDICFGKKFDGCGLSDMHWDLASWSNDGVTTGNATYWDEYGHSYPTVLKTALSPMTLDSLIDLYVPHELGYGVAGGATDLIHGGISDLTEYATEQILPYHIAFVAFTTPNTKHNLIYPIAEVDIHLPYTGNSIEVFSEVSDELLRRLSEFPEQRFQIQPSLFEKVVAELLQRMGFNATLTPPSGDQGRDIIASIGTPVDPVLMLVECKRYSPHRLVGPEPIARLWCRIFDEGANLGMIVTTSGFQPVAKREAALRRSQMTLKDGIDFIGWVRQVLAEKKS